MSADDLLMASTHVERTPDGGYGSRGTAFWDIVRQYRISVDSEPRSWVFVQWAPDREMIEAGCEFRYELYELTPGGVATRLAWNSYGCDV